MEIARGTDLPDLLASLGYTVTRIGRYYSTKEMDSLRIKNRRTWYRYSERVGGDAITFLQHFCGRSFPEAVEDLLAFHGRARDAPRSGAGKLSRRRNRRNRLHCRPGTPMPAECTPT
ncbi:hypothetical protein M5E87_28605 [Flavonifractor plautii]|nr:hypothetical protein M5E87_28605 [Flavonifractor plautii]